MLNKITKFKDVLIKWIKENKLEFILLCAVLIFGFYLRLYRISEYMTFLGDEGRDALLVRRLLVDFDIILIGPGTSIGNMYLGPLYYYLIAPALFLFNFSPVGPSVIVALIGVATIFLVWKITREWFGKAAAFSASLLYATAPVVIDFSRSSWNPNIMPFFALLCIYSIWRVWQYLEYKWLIILGVSFAFVLQSHYLGLLLLPTIGLFWLLTLIKNNNFVGVEIKYNRVKFFKQSLLGLALFGFLMSPLLVFDLRHNWINFNAIKVFFTERQTTVSARPWTSLPKLPEISTTVMSSLTGSHNEKIGSFSTGVFSVFIVILLFNSINQIATKKINPKKLSSQQSSFMLLTVWLLFAFIGFGIYKQHIYDHYFGFIFPAPFMLLGGISKYVINKTKFIGTVVVISVISYLLFVNLNNSHLKYPPNRQLQRAEAVAKKINEESGGQKVNLAVLAERNYEDGYQYFLESWSVPFVEIDPQRVEETIADQLFIVCEMPKEKCDPVNSPKAEVANFGWSRVEGEWDVAGVTLYRLVHAK